MDLFEAFDFQPGAIVAAVGGGGKTSLVYALGTEAAAMGLSVGRVSQIERGEVTSVEVLGRYADAVGGRLRVVIDFGDELIAV